MNERIKEFSDQAREYALESMIEFSHTPIESLKVYDRTYNEKFAELIVRECARIAAQTPCPNFHEHLKQQLGHTWDMACVESAKDIRKHFGVEV